MILKRFAEGIACMIVLRSGRICPDSQVTSNAGTILAWTAQPTVKTHSKSDSAFRC